MVTSAKCEWCNGTGTDSESNIFNGCPDCQGTGYEFGEKGRLKHLKEMKQDDDKIDWEEVDETINELRGYDM